MTRERIAKESYQLLLRILNQAFARREENNVRQAFIYRHGQTVLRLSEDIFFLEGDGRCYSSPIVIRVMLESLFNLVSAVKHEHFAAEKLIWEAEDELRRIEKWLVDEEESMKETIETLHAFASSFRKQNNITGKLNWNTLACAQAAELNHHYRYDYFVFSKNVHAATSGIISSETGFGRGRVLQTAIFVILAATGHVVQALPTKTPQLHLNRSTKLMKELCRAIERQEFKEPDMPELQ